MWSLEGLLAVASADAVARSCDAENELPVNTTIDHNSPAESTHLKHISKRLGLLHMLSIDKESVTARTYRPRTLAQRYDVRIELNRME